jgi:hypothetical protein
MSRSETPSDHAYSKHLGVILPYRLTDCPLNLPQKENLAVLKANLARAYPVAETPSFDNLLRAIDLADREFGLINKHASD